MPVPKKRHSKSRRDSRRATWKVKASSLAKCPRCGEPFLPYQVCPACGTYKGQQVLPVKVDKDKKDKGQKKKGRK